jgi:hypothetical protein
MHTFFSDHAHFDRETDMSMTPVIFLKRGHSDDIEVNDYDDEKVKRGAEAFILYHRTYSWSGATTAPKFWMTEQKEKGKHILKTIPNVIHVPRPFNP